MPLREEFEQTGNWLFRWRSYLPIALAAMLTGGALHAGRSADAGIARWPWLLVCAAVSGLGLLVRALVVAHTPRRTSGRSTSRQVAYQLNTTGMYSIVRHPLYQGNFMIWLGLALSVQVWWLVAIYVLLFCVYYERIMFAEEEFLRRQFGQAYVDWATRTPAFWPRVRQWQQAALPFSARNVLKREYTAVCGIAVGLAGLETIRQSAAAGRFVMHPVWIVVMSGILALAAGLRSVKKHTDWLKVEGR